MYTLKNVVFTIRNVYGVILQLILAHQKLMQLLANTKLLVFAGSDTNEY